MEENFDIPVDNEESFDELLHYGTKYHSGRYCSKVLKLDTVYPPIVGHWAMHTHQ